MFIGGRILLAEHSGSRGDSEAKLHRRFYLETTDTPFGIGGTLGASSKIGAGQPCITKIRIHELGPACACLLE